MWAQVGELAMGRMTRRLGILALMLAGTVGRVEAAPVTYTITATISDVFDPSGLLGPTIAVGGTLTGSYTFDDATLDTNSDPTVGDYWHIDAGYGIRLQGGGYTFETDPSNVEFLVEIVNRPDGDNYLLRSYNNLPLATGAPVDHIAGSDNHWNRKSG
jgi:hypothetical protein